MSNITDKRDDIITDFTNTKRIIGECYQKKETLHI